ncbi:MAG: hypothetical protein HYV35_04765 [Lentisphaerae bacterium]|nr:hypothetical protein [Lentisphaerota bacterium]
MKGSASKVIALSAIGGLLVLTGCAMFRIKVQDKDVENLPAYDATYGAQDLRNLAEKVASSIATSDLIKNQAGNLIMIIYGVQPRTTTFVDTQAMTDRLRNTLMQKSGNKIQFVNESHRQEVMKEQGFQAMTATDDTRVAIGKQLGAKYMLTGALIEMQKQTGRQVRVSKTELVYYQLTIEITDLETGIIAWSTQEEFARAARQPLIGW